MDMPVQQFSLLSVVKSEFVTPLGVEKLSWDLVQIVSKAFYKVEFVIQKVKRRYKLPDK